MNGDLVLRSLLRAASGPIIWTALVLVLLAPATAVRAAALRVAGCDLLSEAWRSALTHEARRAGVELTLTLEGTLPGREALEAGRADVAVLLHSPEDDEAGTAAAEFRRIPVAWVAVIVAVADDNPVHQITYEQLAAVFGATSGQAARYWRDLGATDDWAGRPVVPASVARSVGLTLDFFSHAVLLDRSLQAGLPTFPTVADALERIGLERGAILLVPALPAGARGVRPLRVTAAAGEVAFGPSPENIATGDYPLRLPLELVFRAGREKDIAPVARAFVSTDGVAALEQSHLVALPEGARARLVGEFRAR